MLRRLSSLVIIAGGIAAGQQTTVTPPLAGPTPPAAPAAPPATTPAPAAAAGPPPAPTIVPPIAEPAAPTPGPSLSLHAAIDLALRNHPEVLAAQAEVQYQGQQVIEAQAALYPVLNGDLTGSQSNVNARIGAGYLTSSRLFNRFGQGVTLSQLVTDLGRTSSLIASSRLQGQASDQTYQATKFDVTLAVTRAYYDALRAQAVVKVARETVAARELLQRQVSALATAKLKSELDVAFADVAVSEASLMLLRAEDDVLQAYSELARALGSDQVLAYQLAEEPIPPTPPETPNGLITQALMSRPELASLKYVREAAYKFADAERDLKRPSVTVDAVAGFLPLINQEGSTRIPAEYEGVAMNVHIPIFNGHEFTARYEAARYHALAADQRLRDEQLRVARDVRAAWATTLTSYRRIDVTAEFLRQAALGMNLAQGRYDLGLSSIVELTQAQLNLTQAEIENLNAKYDYQNQYSTLQYATGQLR